MGRPDLSGPRRDQILDALERCVARDGLAGTSLDAIAAEAGVKRQLIRHYLGNRDEVVRAFGRRLVARLRADVEAMTAALPGRDRVAAMLEMLFGGAPGSAGDSAASVLLLESMIASAEREPEFSELVAGYVEALVDAIGAELRRERPGASASDVRDVASGIVGLCFHDVSLRPLGPPWGDGRTALAAARRLVSTLGSGAG